MSAIRAKLNIPLIFNGEFDNFIKHLMAEWEVQGLSLGIIPLSSDNPPTYKTYGTAYKDQAITSKTRFPICSLTKLFTSLTILRLLDEHSLTPDTPIRTVLPNFRLRNETDSKQVTFAHALSHSAGVETADVMYTNPSAQGDMIEYLSTLPCATLPGEKAFYSNYMYDILGLAIEALSGQSIESVFQEKIFEPLGMSSTSFQGEAGIDDVAMGLTPALEKEKSVASQGGILVGTGPDIGIQSILKNRNGMVKGSYCIISTTEDMSKWAKSLSSNPYYLKATQSQIEIIDGWYPGHSIIDSPLKYGMGMFLSSYANNNTSIMDHYENTAGYGSHLSIIPELGISIVVLSNSEGVMELRTLPKFWAINKSLGLSMEEIITALGRERDDRLAYTTKDLKPVIGLNPLPPNLPSGKYQGPGLGIWNLSSETYKSTRPRCINIPYLPWLYGRCTPMLTPVKEGVFEGCMEWTNMDGEVYHGCPFHLEVNKEGDVEITGFDWGDKGEMCILRKDIHV